MPNKTKKVKNTKTEIPEGIIYNIFTNIIAPQVIEENILPKIVFYKIFFIRIFQIQNIN